MELDLKRARTLQMMAEYIEQQRETALLDCPHIKAALAGELDCLVELQMMDEQALRTPRKGPGAAQDSIPERECRVL